MEILLAKFDSVSNESGSLSDVFLNIDLERFINIDNESIE